MKHNKICKLLLLTTIFGMLTACGGGNSSVVPSSQTSQQSQSEKSNPSVDPGSSTISISSIESSVVPSSKQEDVLHGTLTYTGVGELRVDGTLNVVATYHWAEGDPIDLTKFSFSWIAGDPSVISLTPNKNKCDVKGLKTGSSSLKISFGNISTETTINVLDKYVAVESVTLSEHALNFTVGDGSKTLVATVLPENATVKNVTWSSSADNIASVNNGVVTPVAAGDAVITATCDGKSDTCTVCVVDQPTPTVYDYQAVINGVNIPLTKNESATGEHLDAEYQAKGVEVVLGQSVKFINKDGQELSEKFGAEPDSPTEYNNVINNEGAYTIRQSGTVDIYLKIWDTPWTNFWITGGGSIEPVKENWVAHYYDASEQNWSDLALNLNETTGEYELEKIILEGDKFCVWNSINSQEEAKWLHYSEVKYNDQLLVSADNDGNILVNDPAKYGIYVNVTENKIGLSNKSYSIKVDEETSNLSMKLDRTSEDPKTGTVEYTLTNVDLNAQKVLEFYKDGTKIETSSISIKNGANAYVEDGVIHVHNDFAAAEGKGIFLEKTSEGYALWVDGFAEIEKWVVHYYDHSDQTWSDISLNLNETTGEYELEKIILEGDKFCVWNGLNSESDAKWLHYSEVKYNDQLLASADNDGNILVNDPAKYGIYVNVTENKIGLSNKSYSIKVDEETSNLSMKLDRTSEDPKTGTVEYTLTNVDLKAQSVLEFYKDGTKIDSSLIEIKDGANARKNDGIITVHGDFDATEGKGIFLEKTSEGYLLWVDSRETPHWYIHYFDATTQEWSDIKMNYEDDIFDYTMKFYVGDKVCFWNGMEGNKAQWLHADSLMSEMMIPFDQDSDKNIVCKYEGTYLFTTIIFDGVAYPYIVDCSVEFTVGETEYNSVAVTYTQGRIEYNVKNIENINEGTVVSFTKNGVAIPTSKITIEEGSNALIEDGVIKINNNASNVGIYLKTSNLEENFILWVDGYVAPAEINYALHGKVNGSTKWKDYEMTQSTETGKEAEYLLKDVVMKAGDEFCFKYNGDTWYKYDDIKEGCLDLFTEAESDNNIVIKEDGVYNFYVGLEDDKGNFIWASRRDFVAFYLLDNEDQVISTLAYDEKDDTYYSGVALYGTTGEYYISNCLTGEDLVEYYFDDFSEYGQQHFLSVGEGEDKLFKFKVDGKYSFVITSDYSPFIFNDSLTMKIDGETIVKLDPSNSDGYWYGQFKEYDLDAETKLEFFYCDEKIDPTTVTLEEGCNAVVDDGYFKLINDFVVEDNNIIKLTVNDGYSLKIDGTETPTVTTYGYTINDGVMHELTEGNTNEWVAEDVVLTPNDIIAFYDCHEDSPVLIPVALETSSSSNFRISDDKLVSYWGGTFDLYLKLAYENDKVYVEGEVTIPAITYTLHYGDPIPVEFNEGQWSITEIELGANEVIELFADGEPYPFILESGCTVTGLDFDGSKATSTVDDSTFSFYVKESGQTWINRNYPSVTIKLNVDTFTDWKKDNAWFAAYVYTNEAKDGHFEYLNSDLELKTTTQYSYFSFIRMIPNTNPSYDSSNGGLNWNNKWNQTPDQSFSLSDDGETYNVTDWNSGSWQS